VAVRAENSDVVRTVVGPIAVDVLDLQRHPAGIGIPLTPSALLALLTRRFDDVLPHNPVEVQSRRQLTGTP
jgi:hypothetical protein